MSASPLAVRAWTVGHPVPIGLAAEPGAFLVPAHARLVTVAPGSRLALAIRRVLAGSFAFAALGCCLLAPGCPLGALPGRLPLAEAGLEVGFRVAYVPAAPDAVARRAGHREARLQPRAGDPAL